MENKLDFSSILEMIEASYDGNIGELKDKIDEAFDKTVKRVVGSGKRGTLTVTLTFETINNNKIGVEATVSTKLPEPRADGKILYHDLRGNLVNDDPMQPKLFDNVKPLKRVNEGEEAK
ncbi:MAG: hypothetical protein II961_00395 [Candidatus Riflebacteria bacterium]|nr:hypothetical protein [Candidatus Riflebacteria bacterium]